MRTLRFLPLAALCLASSLAAIAQGTCTTTWTNANGGAWADASNWSSGVPTTADRACVLLAGTYTITTSRIDALSLRFGGDAGTQTLVLSGPTTLTEPSTLGPNAVVEWLSGYLEAGTLLNEGLIRFTGANASRGARGETAVLRNTGTVTWEDSGILYVYNSARFENAGAFDVSGTGSLRGFSGVGTFVTEAGATLTKTGDALWEIFGRLTVENEGTWAVEAGTVEVEEASTLRDATLAVAEGARLQFNRPLTVEGTLTSAPAGQLALNAAMTAGPGATLAVTGTGFEWLAGYLEEGRLLNRELIRFTGANASRGARGETAVLRNTGTVTWEDSGILYVYNSARFENAGAFDVSGTGSLRGFSGVGTFVTERGATLTKTGDALWEIFGALTVENEGTWAVEGGAVEVEEASTLRDATLAVAEGARLQFNRPLTVEGTLTSAPAGRLALNAAMTAGSDATLAVTGTGFEWLAGYLEEGRLLNRELIRFTGANASRGARGETAVLRNTGTVTWEDSGILYVYNSARFENAGAFDVSGTGSLRGFSGVGTFVTEPTATLTKTGDALWEIFGALTVENEGTWAVEGGAVEVEEASTLRDATLAVAEGARLQFNRPLTVEGTLTSAPAGQLALNAAMTAGPGATLAVTGTGFEWLAGYLEEGRLLNRELIRFTGANASRGARGATAVLRNQGTVTWEDSGILYVYNSARFENAGAFDVSGTGSLRGFSGIGTFVTERGATLTKTGDALWEIFGSLTVENAGLWSVEDGAIELEEATTHRDARLNVSAGARLQFNRPLTVLGTLSSNAAGALVLNTNLLTDRTAFLDIAGQGLDWRSGYVIEGTLINQRRVRLTGASNNRGVRGEGAVFRNAGTMEWRNDGLFYVYNSARFENAATLDVVGNGGLRGFSGTGTFVNESTGTFTRRGDGVFFFGSDVERNRSFEPLTATLDGSVALGGEIDAIGLALTNRADFDVTGPEGDVGALTWTGDFVADDATDLRLDVSGPGANDELFVVPNTRAQAFGTAQLDGTLNLVLRDGYVPEVGTSFDLITAEAITGGFTDLTALTVESAGLSLYPSITDEVFRVTAAEGIPTIAGSLEASPSQVRGGTRVPLTLTGTGFAPDLRVDLTCVECADPVTYGTLAGQLNTITPTSIGLGLDLTPGDIYGTYEIRVSDPRGGEATTTLVILPPDLTLTVEVRRADASELGNRAGTVVVRSNRQTLAPVTVPFALGGSAQRLADYVTTELGDALTLPLGVTELQVGIIPVNDDLAESSETVTFTLLDTPDYALGSPFSGTVTIADGPPRGDFAAFSVSPRRGGDMGLLTLTVVGQNFTDGATVTLNGVVPALESLETQVGEDGTSLRAVFDLSRAPIGTRDVVVVNGDGGSTTLVRAFSVEQSVGADVWVTLVGPEAVRRGRPGTFSLIYGNDGNVDAAGGIFTVMGIPLGADVTFDDSFELPPLPGQVETELTPVIQDENEQYIVLGAVGLAPGVARTSTFTITTSADYTLQLFAFSDADARVAGSGRRLSGFTAHTQRTAAPVSRSNDIPGLIAAEAYLASTAARNNFVTRAAEFTFTLGRDGACVGAAIDNFENLSALTFGTDSPLFGWGVEVVTKNGTGVGHTTVLLTSPDGNAYIADNYTGIPVILPMEQSGDNYFPAPENALSPINAPYLVADGVVNISSAFGGDQFYTLFDERYQTSLRPKPDEQQPVVTVNSFDPNDKIGPGGAGEARYIASTEPMPYLVRFENLDTATAPAAEVIVVDTLDLAVFDPASLTLGPVTFGERLVPVPPGLQDYATTVDLRPAEDLLVLIALTLEPTSGILTARFTSLDPDTGELPEDPFAGFLPPNVTPPEGEGSISFVVAPRDDTGSGTVLRNEARIFFDLNEPIDTPPWINTVDLTAPTSSVVALGETLSDSVFTVTWAGNDANAGVSGYDVYVSQEDGPFEPWLLNYAETSATFVGRNGGRYAFYSIASDFAGNVEPPKTEAEASTTVVVSAEGDVGLPERVTLTQPYPNPASSAMTVPFGLPTAGTAEIEVFDLLGRRVVQLATGDHPAGWHTLRWDVGRLAAGVYVLRLRAEGVAETRRVTIVR